MRLYGFTAALLALMLGYVIVVLHPPALEPFKTVAPYVVSLAGLLLVGDAAHVLSKRK